MGAPTLNTPDINAPAVMPKQPATTSVATTESPATPITPEPTMGLANSAPQTTVSGAGTTVKPFDNFDLKSVPPEQQPQVAKQTMQQHMQAQSPEDQKGVQDLHAKKNTPEAQQLQAKVEQSGQKVMQDDVAQQAQANPELAQTPQGFGQMWNQASENWNSMPQEAKWMVGLGVPIAAVGLMSALFGKGGGGMGLLGLLGLGAAGLGGAAGGFLFAGVLVDGESCGGGDGGDGLVFAAGAGDCGAGAEDAVSFAAGGEGAVCAVAGGVSRVERDDGRCGGVRLCVDRGCGLGGE
jgi:hypothetical protein